MVVGEDVLSLKPILNLGLDGIVRHAECQPRLFQRYTRVRSQYLSTSVSTSLTNLFDGRTATSVLLPGTHPAICEVTAQVPKLFHCNNSRTTQGHNLFMFKGSAFRAHKNRMKAWSCFERLFHRNKTIKRCF